MNDYKTLIKYLFLFVFIIYIIKLNLEKNELRSVNHRLLRRQKKESQLIIEKKLVQIDSLKNIIERNDYLINEALVAINDLQKSKVLQNKIYIERVKVINSFDAIQLKEYFNEELK